MKRRFKSEKGATGMDIALGLVIFVITSTVVLNMYYRIYMYTIATKVHSVLVGCITDIFERVDLENYDNITDANIEEWLEYKTLIDNFNEQKNGSTVECTVTSSTSLASDAMDLVKDVRITVKYDIGGNKITFPIEKLKIKELSK